MSRTIATTALAAFVLSFAAGGAAPVLAQDQPVFFDLGIDVTQLPQDVAGAKKYFAAQPAETQRVLLAACHTYILHPMDAAMPQTLVFCRAIQ